MIFETYPQPITDDPLVYKVSLNSGERYLLIIFGGYANDDKEAFPVLEKFPEFFDYDDDLDSLVLKKDSNLSIESVICALTEDPFESVKIAPIDKLDVLFDPEFDYYQYTDEFIGKNIK